MLFCFLFFSLHLNWWSTCLFLCVFSSRNLISFFCKLFFADDDDQSKHSQHSEGSKGESLHSETRSVESGDASDSDIDATEEGSSPLKRKLPKVSWCPRTGICCLYSHIEIFSQTKSSSSIKGKKVRSIVDSEGEEEQEEEEDEEREGTHIPAIFTILLRVWVGRFSHFHRIFIYSASF